MLKRSRVFAGEFAVAAFNATLLILSLVIRMSDNPQFWISAAIALFGLLFSAVVAWYQERRDLKIMLETGVYPSRAYDWLEVLLLIGGTVLLAGALSFLKDNRDGGAQPVIAVSMALVAIGFHILLLRRIKGRIEVGIGASCGVIMALMAIIYASVKFL